MNATNDAICGLMAENGNMKALLLELLPDMESRVEGLRQAWPGRDVLTALHRNEAHVRKIKEFTEGFVLPSNDQPARKERRMRQYEGNDNYGRPKADYLAEIAAMDDDSLYDECYAMIYQSARCANNPRSDWHWMVDACYDEASKRDPGAPVYSKAYERCRAEHAG